MKKRGQRGAIIAVLLIGLLIFGGVYFAWTTVIDIFQPVNTDQGNTVAIVIQSGDDARQIADELQAKGIIRNALAFRIWARIKGLDTHLQAGAYNLNTSMTIDQSLVNCSMRSLTSMLYLFLKAYVSNRLCRG